MINEAVFEHEDGADDRKFENKLAALMLGEVVVVVVDAFKNIMLFRGD